MARYAMVHTLTGFVANVIEWDGNLETWQPAPGYEMVPDEPPTAGPGYTYRDGKFEPPPSGQPGTAAG